MPYAIEPHYHSAVPKALNTRIHLPTAEIACLQIELFAEELRLARNALSKITGQFTSDDLLGVIFSRFCIGK